MRAVGMWGAVVALALLVGAGGCAGREDVAKAQQAAQRTMVLGAGDVARVARADLVVGVPVSGTLEPAVDIHITAPSADLIESVAVKEGQRVARGQVLARFRVSALGPAAASAEAQRRIAESDYRRMQNLLKEGAASERDVENAEAALRAAEASAAGASNRLHESTVRAPVAGVIAQRHVQSGDRVGDGDPLFRLVDTAELEFQATVPSEYASRIVPGATVELEVSGAAARVTGRVARVNATADPATRQIRVYVTVPNRDHRLAGDLFASGRVVLASMPAALSVPSSAVRDDDAGGRFAWVVADGRVVRRGVEPGLHDAARDLVEIKRGLAAGEIAITGPVEGLRDGQPVQLAGSGS